MRKIMFLLVVGLISTVSAQNTIWAYHATGSFWVHIRSIKNIPDVDSDDHADVIAVSENDTLYCLSGMSGALSLTLATLNAVLFLYQIWMVIQ